MKQKKIKTTLSALFLLTFHTIQGDPTKTRESFFSNIAFYSELMMVGSLCMLPVFVLLVAYVHAKQKALETQKEEVDKNTGTAGQE